MIGQSPVSTQMSAGAGFFGQFFAGGAGVGAAAGGVEGLFTTLLGQMQAGGAGLLAAGTATGEETAATASDADLAKLADLLGKNGFDGTEPLSPEMLAALQAALATAEPQPIAPTGPLAGGGGDMLLDAQATPNAAPLDTLPPAPGTLPEAPRVAGSALGGAGMPATPAPGDAEGGDLITAPSAETPVAETANAETAAAADTATPAANLSRRRARDPLFDQLARMASGQRGGGKLADASLTTTTATAGPTTDAESMATTAKAPGVANDSTQPATQTAAQAQKPNASAPGVSSHGHAGDAAQLAQRTAQAGYMQGNAAQIGGDSPQAQTDSALQQATILQSNRPDTPAAPLARPTEPSATAPMGAFGGFGAGSDSGDDSLSDGESGKQGWGDAEFGSDGPTTTGESVRTGDNGFARLVQQSTPTGGARQPMHPASQQLAVHIQRGVADGRETLRVQLNPRELGLIDIQLEFDGGRLRARISAEKPETLDQLSKDSKQLERALQEAGLDVDSQSLEFSLNDGGGAQAQDDGQNRAGTRASRQTQAAAADETVQTYTLGMAQDGRVNFSV
jgi:flagellar hook-length control protein FliK